MHTVNRIEIGIEVTRIRRIEVNDIEVELSGIRWYWLEKFRSE